MDRRVRGPDESPAVWDGNSPETQLVATAPPYTPQNASPMMQWPSVAFTQLPDFAFSFVGPGLHDITGLSEADCFKRPDAFWSIVHEQDLKPVRDRIQEEAISCHGSTGVFRVRHAETGRISFLWEHRLAVKNSSGVALGFRGVWIDITRQVLAERSLLKLSWKDNLSTLTIGLAHDFANLLGVVSTLSDFVGFESSSESTVRERFDLIHQSATKAVALNRKLRELHHSKPGRKAYYDLNDLVRSTTDVLAKALPPGTRLSTELAGRQLAVFVDAFALRQTLVDLLLGTRDMIPAGGELRISSAWHAEAPAVEHLQGIMPEGPVVCLTVHNSNMRVPAGGLAALMNPFSSQNPFGFGPGNALLTASSFANSHHAAVSVEAQPMAEQGAGITFWMADASLGEPPSEAPVRHTLLVIGQNDTRFTRLLSGLRAEGLYALPLSDPSQIEETLADPRYQFTGVLVLHPGPGPSDKAFAQIRAHKLPTILAIQDGGETEPSGERMRSTDSVVWLDSNNTGVGLRVKRILNEARL